MIYKMVKTAVELQTCLQIRQVVFTKEQGISADADLDVNDISAAHFLAREKNAVIGTVRVYLKKSKAIIGRLVVLKKFRGQGIGAQLMMLAIRHAKGKKADQAVASCQVSAVSFYEKLGFKKKGKIYLQVGIPHIKMFLNL